MPFTGVQVGEKVNAAPISLSLGAAVSIANLSGAFPDLVLQPFLWDHSNDALTNRVLAAKGSQLRLVEGQRKERATHTSRCGSLE